MKTIGITQIGKAKVIVDIVPKGNPEIRPAYAMKPTKIAIHNTGNSGRGANAKAHNTYIHNMAKLSPKDTGYASWHFSVDDKFIYQHIPLDESAWHTGDGSGVNSGNRTAIGIEICENVDMENYHQAEENAIALTVYLMKQLNINIQNVKSHQAFSGKFCPRVILKRDGGFSKFHNRIKVAYEGQPAKQETPAPSQPQNTTNVRVGQVTNDVWTQKQPSFSETGRVKILKKGTRWKVYGEQNGYYKVGSSEWINKKYMKIVEEQKYIEITSDVWSQRNASFSETGRVKVLKKGSVYKAYGEQNGYINLGSEWVNNKYAKYVQK